MEEMKLKTNTEKYDYEVIVKKNGTVVGEYKTSAESIREAVRKIYKEI